MIILLFAVSEWPCTAPGREFYKFMRRFFDCSLHDLDYPFEVCNIRSDGGCYRWKAEEIMGAKKQEPRCKLVAYYRTSTDDPKLGIEAQKATAARVSETTGCKAEKVFTEHESGGNNDRVELDKAIRCARRIGATLVVAKLDRLPRDSAFLMKLYGGDVPILFGDMPEVDGRTSTGRSANSDDGQLLRAERRRIGERTREALAASRRGGQARNARQSDQRCPA